MKIFLFFPLAKQRNQSSYCSYITPQCDRYMKAWDMIIFERPS